ncbi:MAG: hypothetical protein HQM13_21050 [SAR324 cluster bacterium]|nr:hypothetical protein [SAR324 cluster bacterium]
MQVQNTAVSSKDQPLASQNKEIKTAKPAIAGKKDVSAEKAAESPPQKTSEQTSTYLKVLSRLENMIKKDELPDKAVESFTKAVTTRLKEADDQEKKVLLGTVEAKALKIKNVDDIPKMIEDGLEDDGQMAKVFALLKQPQFVELMNGEDNQSSQTYGPNGKSAVSDKADKNQAATPPGSKVAGNEGEGIKNQAMQAIKAVQAAKAGGSPAGSKQAITEA